MKEEEWLHTTLSIGDFIVISRDSGNVVFQTSQCKVAPLSLVLFFVTGLPLFSYNVILYVYLQLIIDVLDHRQVFLS
jgi:hypothetical protein